MSQLAEHEGGTFEETSYKDFRAGAGEFFKATLDRSALSKLQVRSGFKALSIMYLCGSDDWTEREIEGARVILKLAANRAMDVERAGS